MKFIGLGAPELSVLAVMIASFFLLAIIPAKIAAKKGYSFGGFYAFGVFFWLIALIVALVIKYKSDGVANELLSYKQLLDSGIITQEEFETRKTELMNR